MSTITRHASRHAHNWRAASLAAFIVLVAFAANFGITDSVQGGTSTTTLKVEKVINDGKTGTAHGIFDLYIAGVLRANNINDPNNTDGLVDGMTPVVTVIPGTVSFHETAGNPATDLSDFTITVSCVGGGTALTPTGTGAWTIFITSGEEVVCTITNARSPTAPPTIKIVKDVVPDDATTNWVFNPGNRQINGGDGMVGPFVVDAGPNRTITETAGASTTLSDYATTSACVDQGGPIGTGGTSVTFDIDVGDQIVCTFTNAETGSISVIKDFVPNSVTGDTADFTLTGGPGPIAPVDQDGVTEGAAVVLATGLTTGSYVLTEDATSGAFISLSCVGTAAGNLTIGPIGLNQILIALQPGENVVCTFVNGSTPPQTPTQPGAPFIPFVPGVTPENILTQIGNDAGDLFCRSFRPDPVVLSSAGVSDPQTFCELNIVNETGGLFVAILIGLLPGDYLMTVERILAGDFVPPLPGTNGGTLGAAGAGLFVVNGWIYDVQLFDENGDPITEPDGVEIQIQVEEGEEVPVAVDCYRFDEASDAWVEVSCTIEDGVVIITGVTSLSFFGIVGTMDPLQSIASTFFTVRENGDFYLWGLCDGNAADFFLNHVRIAWLWIPHVGGGGEWIPFIPELWLSDPTVPGNNNFAIRAGTVETAFLWLVGAGPGDQTFEVCGPSL